MKKVSKKKMDKSKEIVQKEKTDISNSMKAEPKAIANKYTEEEIRSLALKLTSASCDPKQIIKELGELLPQFLDGKNEARKEIRSKLNEKIKEALTIFGLETHYPLAETVGSQYRPLAIEFTNQLIKEYDCKMPSEIALTEIISGSFIRILEYSERFNRCTRIEFLSHEKNGYYSMLSKELDRAQRHFITALTTLKQLKSPDFKVDVIANTAFISQNQQINAIEKNKEN